MICYFSIYYLHVDAMVLYPLYFLSGNDLTLPSMFNVPHINYANIYNYFDIPRLYSGLILKHNIIYYLNCFFICLRTHSKTLLRTLCKRLFKVSDCRVAFSQMSRGLSLNGTSVITKVALELRIVFNRMKNIDFIVMQNMCSI